jgi:hypothetical protein
MLVNKYLALDWGGYTFRMRRWRFRHNKRPRNIYLQFGPLEITVWYR